MVKPGDRRRFIAGLGVLVLGGPVGPALSAAGATGTPASTEGPFYPDRLPLDDDNDLLKVEGVPGLAKGTPLDLHGRILSSDGKTLPGARIEIWQCDANGIYLHSDAPRRPQFDPGFQGFGRTAADGDGAYRFRTIVPVRYSGRTPHIHFRIVAPNGRSLTTQMYIAGHPGNADDFLFRRLRTAEERRAASAELTRGDDATDAMRGRFDIVLA